MSRLLKSRDVGAQAGVMPLRATRPGTGKAETADPASLPLHTPAPLSAAAMASAAETAAIDRPMPPAVRRKAQALPDQEWQALESIITELRQKLLESQDNADAREEAAYERGMAEGLQAAASDEAARSEMLRQTLEGVQASIREHLTDAETLALQLARTALARIFGDGGERAGQVADALRHRLGQMKRELVTAAIVSAEDFSEPAALAKISQSYPGVSIECSSDLASGECLLQLRLGMLDIGIPGQWHRLREFFDSLSAGERAA